MRPAQPKGSDHRVRNELSELWRFRGLLWQLVKRDLKVRYKNSRLGFIWSIAPPLLQVAVITFAFKHATSFARNFPSYSAFLLVAMIPWTHISTSVLDSSQSILNMYGVIRKVYLPREIIPLAGVISNFIHFLISWGVFFIYWWGIRGEAVLATTLLLPVLLIIQLAFVTGIGFIVAALNVFYEDVKYMLTVLLSLGLFLFPIVYLVEQVQPTTISSTWLPLLAGLYQYNVVSALITGYRKVLLESPSPEALGGMPSLPLDYNSLILAGFQALIALAIGYWYFNRRKWQFVERP